MTTINLSEIKSHLSHYANRVKSGETIILCDRNKPFAEIRPLPDPAQPAPKRQLGLMKGMCPVGPDFFEADTEISADFETSEIFPAATTHPQP